MSDYVFSVIIPAHNEEKYIAKCIDAIKRASEKVGADNVQIIVSANRCTDNTVEIASAMGAEICENTVIMYQRGKKRRRKARQGRYYRNH